MDPVRVLAPYSTRRQSRRRCAVGACPGDNKVSEVEVQGAKKVPDVVESRRIV